MSPNFDIIDQLIPNNCFHQDLYHYTSAEGLQGIIASQALHCSHIFYLNDAQESIDIWSHFFQSLAQWPAVDSQANHFVQRIHQYFAHWRKYSEQTPFQDFQDIKMDQHLLYVMSFSHVADDLSQWRGYTSQSFGFSLKFHFTDNFLQQQGHYRHYHPDKSYSCVTLLRDCIYDNTQKATILQALLQYTFQRFVDGTSNWESDLFFHLLTLGIFFKHDKFAAESECRLVILPFPHTQQVLFKKGKSYLVPYIQLDLTNQALQEVCIGPTPYPVHSAASVRMLLQAHRNALGHVGVTCSAVPYRYW